MSESWGGRVNELKSWFKETVGKSDREIDTDMVISRIRETVAKAERDVDAEAVVARIKATMSKAEGAVDSEKFKQWVDDVDGEKLKGWVAEARERAAKLRGDG
jgi:uncharacterized protein YbcI